MAAVTSFDQAVHSVQTTGGVMLKGAPSSDTGALRVLTTVLIGLVLTVAVGGLVFVPIALTSGVRFTVASVFGIITVYALLAALVARLVFARRGQGRYAEIERLPVSLDAAGLTLRGVGPIPWGDFAPAQYDLVINKSSGNYTRRAILRLSDSGLIAVNQHLPAELRERLGPSGNIWDRRHRWIAVPGVEALHEREVMQLINWVQTVYLGRPGGQV
ncbi:hypothetical protein [Streptomyces sp. NPDC058045]|uniref:hypothetical protein n=1 Tax=Streptomyces sp. NPDC058045 TaxID=3346311 RepID=UPI0036F16E14